MKSEISKIDATVVDAPSLDERDTALYEAPAVESVLTPESLEREVHYAGIQTGSGVAAA